VNTLDAESQDLGFSFSSKHRLHTANDFSLVFSARRVLRGDYFNLHYLAARPASLPAEAGARIGLVVAKKLARRAVQRNLLKRLAREAFRHAHAQLPPYDLILRLSRPAAGHLKVETRRAWRADIDQLLKRLILLAQNQRQNQ
jgi:ribonuclease P protein component